MTTDADAGRYNAATLAVLVQECALLDEASREYWLDLLPALDAEQRQRLAELLTGDADDAEDTTDDAEDVPVPDHAAGR